MQHPLKSLIIEPEEKATHSIIWLHGLGADCHDFVDIIPEFNLPKELRLRFVFPNAPIRPVTINAGIPTRAWYDIYSLTDLEHEDEAGLKESEKQIHQLIENELAKDIPNENIILAGFSQGGATALFTALRHSQKLAGVLVLSAYLPLVNTLRKEASSANKNTPIFLAHGTVDDILPIAASKMAATLLAQQGYPVMLREYPMGHELCPEEINDITSWLIEISL